MTTSEQPVSPPATTIRREHSRLARRLFAIFGVLFAAAAFTVVSGAAPAQAATPTCDGIGYLSGKWWPDYGLSYDLVVRAPVVNAGPSQSWRCQLYQGLSNNWAVKALQSDINTCYGTTFTGGVALSVDGNFGPLTRQALKNVQAYHRNLLVDGVYGPNTAAEIFHLSWRDLPSGGQHNWHQACDRIDQG
jgi:peptidoglycan hydrolase-like protein with peptidoglycan-binding domain